MDLQSIRDLHPSPARKVYGFLLTFQIFNPNKTKSTILESIPIDPLSESRISIFTKNSEIRPFSSPIEFSGFLYKAANWDLVPTEGSGFRVALQNVFPNAEQKFANLKKLKFIFGRSKFFSDVISMSGRVSFNTPTFRDFQDEVRSMLSTITEDQIKRDVENWYGALTVHQINMFLSDFRKILKMSKIKSLVDSKGKNSSLAKEFIENRVFRKSIQEQLQFEEKMENLINKILDEKNSESVDSYENFMAFLSALEKSFSEIQDHVKVIFNWIKQPKLNNFFQVGNEAYPTVSMKFSTEVELDKELKLKLKGTEEVDGKKVTFDMSSKTTDLMSILSIFKDSLPETIGIYSVFGELIPEGQKYVGWNELEIKKGTKIKKIYEANESLITPSISSETDPSDSNSKFTVFGWKLLDVSVSYDISSLDDVFYQIYSKIDQEKSLWCSLSTWWSCASAALWYRNQPIAFLLSFVNKYVFEDTNSDSPLRTLTKALLKNPIKTDSDQMFVGYSGAFFDVDEAFLEKLKDTSSTSSELIFKTSVQDDDNFFKATPKTNRLSQIINAFDWSYSAFFPSPLMLFRDPSYSEQYQNFLKNEGKSSTGLVKHKEKLKEIIKNNYYEAEKENAIIFPSEKWINWENVKISLTRWKISEALRTLFSKKFTYKVSLEIFRKLDININSFLSELFTRDAFMVAVNFMMAEGTLNFENFLSSGISSSFKSVQEVYVKPNIDLEKFKLEKDFWEILTS